MIYLLIQQTTIVIVSVPTSEGLQFSIMSSPLHYKADANILASETDKKPLHYKLTKEPLHYMVERQPLDYAVKEELK